MKKITREIIIDKNRFKDLHAVNLTLEGPGSGNLWWTEKMHIAVNEKPDQKWIKINIEIESIE